MKYNNIMRKYTGMMEQDRVLNAADISTLDTRDVENPENDYKERKIIALLASVNRFINPPSVFDDAPQRYISLEFLRGISIFFMCMGHEARQILSLSESSEGGIVSFLFYIIGAPIGIFGGFRSFFVLLSGITTGCSFFSRAYEAGVKEMTAETLASFAGSLLLLPFYYIWHCCEWLIFVSVLTEIQISKPFYSNVMTHSMAPIFFGLSTPLNLIIFYCTYIVLIVPLRKYLSKDRLYLVLAVWFTCIAVLGAFLYLEFANAFRYLFSETFKYHNLPYEEWNIECPADTFDFTDNFGEHLELIFMHFCNGMYMSANPLQNFFFVGFSMALLFIRFKDMKHDLLRREDIENAKKEYNRSRKFHLYFFWLVYPLFWAIIASLVWTQNYMYYEQGRRSEFFGFSEFMATQQPASNCSLPEYVYSILPVELIFLAIGIGIFEAGSLDVIKIRTERILYLRRFSSLSLTYFVFSRALGIPILNTLQVWEYQRLYSWEFAGYLVLYFVVTLGLQLALDHAKGKLMPDWIVKRVMWAFELRKREFTEVSDQHLRIMPANLFGKELE